jgi:hypothetical protein
MGTSRDGQGHRAYRRKQAALKRRTHDEQLPCAWCGQPIDTTLPDTDAMSFTADHPEPLAAGGHLVAQDLAPMHRRCNAIKSNAVETEIWAAT